MMKRVLICCFILLFTTINVQAAENVLKLKLDKTYVLFIDDSVFSIINKSPKVLNATLVYSLNAERSEIILKPKSQGESILNIKGKNKSYDYIIQTGSQESVSGEDIVELDEVK